MYQYDTHVLTDGPLMADDIRLLSVPAPISLNRGLVASGMNN